MKWVLNPPVHLTNINIDYLYSMKQALSFLFLVVLSFGLHAQEAHSLLWKISGNGMAKPSYIFGTIHLICPSDYLWTDKMEQSFRACSKACFEMDLDDSSVMTAAAVSFIDPTGKKIKDYYTPADYQRLKKFIKDSIGMDISMMQAMKPVALQSIISMRSVKCKDAVSYEETLMKKAKANNMDVVGLEPVSEQINALDDMPADTVAKELLAAITDFTASKTEFSGLIDAYRSQDLTLLYNKITGSKSLDGSINVLLNDRNKRWISRMGDKMHSGPVFFAVGAGHLAGPEGVLALLRKAGYNIQAVN